MSEHLDVGWREAFDQVQNNQLLILLKGRSQRNIQEGVLESL
jgi:hypothetical protein